MTRVSKEDRPNKLFARIAKERQPASPASAALVGVVDTQ